MLTQPFVILFIVFVVVGILVYLGFHGNPTIQGENLVFRYSRTAGNLVLLSFFSVLAVLFFSAVRNGAPDIGEFGPFEIASAAFFIIGMPAIWIYLVVTRVILTSRELIKITPLSKKIFLYRDIKKIVHYHNRGENPGAMMTRLYTDERKVTLEAFLIGYTQLCEVIESRCTKAVILEK